MTPITDRLLHVADCLDRERTHGIWTLAEEAAALLREAAALVAALTPPPAQNEDEDVTRRDTMGDVAKWTDANLVAALLSFLYRIYDAGGLSCGRSWESKLVEPALTLMHEHRPKGDIANWPDSDVIVQEAEHRERAINRRECDRVLGRSSVETSTAIGSAPDPSSSVAEARAEGPEPTPAQRCKKLVASEESPIGADAEYPCGAKIDHKARRCESGHEWIGVPGAEDASVAADLIAAQCIDWDRRDFDFDKCRAIIARASAPAAGSADNRCQGSINGYVACGLRHGHDGPHAYAPAQPPSAGVVPPEKEPS